MPDDVGQPAKGANPVSQSFSAAHPAPVTLPVLVAPSTSGREKNTLRPSLQAVACWRMNDVRFDLGSSFIKPESRKEIDSLRTLLRHHSGAKMTIFGHADPLGSDDQNKALSGCRAMAMYALLTRRVALWESIYEQPVGPDRWGVTVLQRMLAALGFQPGPADGVEGPKTRDALLAFQRANAIATTGKSDKPTRAALFSAYMDLLCGPDFRVQPADFLAGGADAEGKGDYQGCGEFNAIVRASRSQEQRFAKPEHRAERDDFYSPNRRILILLFQGNGHYPVEKWPCPRALDGASACRKRFWSDHDARRAAGQEERRFEQSQDTLACRFYHRLVEDSPCEYPSRSRRLRIYLHDENGKVLAGQDYTLEVDGALIETAGKTADDGLVDHEVPPDASTGVLRIGRHTWRLSLEHPAPHRDPDGVKSRLANLGFAPQKDLLHDQDRLQFALWDLQSHAGVDTSGEIDDPTVQYLDDFHRRA